MKLGKPLPLRFQGMGLAEHRLAFRTRLRAYDQARPVWLGVVTQVADVRAHVKDPIWGDEAFE